MKVLFANQTYECKRATRTEQNAVLYDENNAAIAKFVGVTDWSAFAVEGGEWEAPEPTPEDETRSQSCYTAMMTGTLLGAQSKGERLFREIGRWYAQNLWDKQAVADAVKKGVLTQEQYEKIVGEKGAEDT